MPDTPWGSDSWLIRRGVKRVIQFHVDHYEPGRKDRGGNVMGLEHVNSWLKDTAQLPWGVKASLIYKSMWLTKIPPEAAANRREKGIPVWEVGGTDFGVHSFGEDTEIVQALVAAQRDFHIHVHHEHWTSGTLTKTPVDGKTDALKLDTMLGWLLERYRNMGVPIEDWGFVHGAWALQGSDTNICNITNEIEILHKHGCIGDFTFPAGRPWCDPMLKVPHTVLPVHGHKAYDTNAAKPLRLERGAHAFTPDRFLIWSTPLHTNFSSLDNVTRQFLGKDQKELLAMSNRAVGEVFQHSPVIDGTLYYKTHAHSLKDSYWRNTTDHESPLTSVPVRQLFRHLNSHCRDYGVPMEFKTLREVMVELREVDR